RRVAWGDDAAPPVHPRSVRSLQPYAPLDPGILPSRGIPRRPGGPFERPPQTLEALSVGAEYPVWVGLFRAGRTLWDRALLPDRDEERLDSRPVRRDRNDRGPCEESTPLAGAPGAARRDPRPLGPPSESQEVVV